MIGGWLRRSFGREAEAAPEPIGRTRLASPALPAVIYAIGDVHGHLDLLRALEARILADAAAIAGEKWLVMLGDYIDRGPLSAQVIDHLIAPPPAGWRRFCLCGNHDDTMLLALSGRKALTQWLAFGGTETLASYGIAARDITAAGTSWSRLSQLLDAHIPAEHRDFLAGLPVVLETPAHVFCHAGLRPGATVDAHSDEDLMWYRNRSGSEDSDSDRIVVHGHTPVDAPLVTRSRINVDTGAYATGRLTAVRLSSSEPPRIVDVAGGI